MKRILKTYSLKSETCTNGSKLSPLPNIQNSLFPTLNNYINELYKSSSPYPKIIPGRSTTPECYLLFSCKKKTQSSMFLESSKHE